MERGQPGLIEYGSETLHSICQKYSVIELEMTTILVYISLWWHVLAHTDFDCCVNHLAGTKILKCKSSPTSLRIGRLFEILLTIGLTYTLLKASIYFVLISSVELLLITSTPMESFPFSLMSRTECSNIIFSTLSK